MFELIRKLFYPIIEILDFITKYFKTFAFITIVYFIVVSLDENGKVGNLQKIELFGTISNIDKVMQQIENAKKDKNIKGVLFVVNSPGGAVAPSVELSYAIKELSSIKPVLAYASGTMASGSYYASIWANKILANPGAIIGSIGVIFQGVNLKELMDTIGVKTQIISLGKYKNTGTMFRQWNSYEKEELEKVIKSTYDMFISDVSLARNLKKENHSQFADAHIFTSLQGKEVGLIDEVATLSKAKKEIIKLSKVSKPIWKKRSKPDKFLDKFVHQFISQLSLLFMSELKTY